MHLLGGWPRRPGRQPSRRPSRRPERGKQIEGRGDNGYRSRDYRYLGTIGFFDSVTLPLKEGRNEVVIAVSESFGGWGLQASLESFEGLTLSP